MCSGLTPVTANTARKRNWEPLPGRAAATVMAKRPRLASVLPALGDDASEFLPDRGLILRHGSSLQLMAQVTAVLRDSQEFGDVDPAADWEKWHSRRPEFSLYYAALIDPARDGDAAILCVLRAVLDGFPEPKPPHRQRMVIDYVTTRVEARSTGLASVIVRFVLESSRLFGANTFVLALEESCPYWMEKGFLLDEGRPLNARLNIFSDTHLLRLHSDPADAGTEEDLELAVAMEVESEGEGEGEEAGPSGGDGSDDDDQMLQAALISSMPSRPPPPPAAAPAACSDDDDELKVALAMSMGAAAPPARSAMAPVAAAGSGGGTEDDDRLMCEDDEFEAAIALSLAPQ